MMIIDTDEQFFRQHTDRQARIRQVHGDESNAEFLSLGPHDRARRRIICWKVPRGSKLAVGKIVKIPFLAFADEAIEDDDRTLLPMIHELMMDAAQGYGMKPPRRA